MGGIFSCKKRQKALANLEAGLEENKTSRQRRHMHYNGRKDRVQDNKASTRNQRETSSGVLPRLQRKGAQVTEGRVSCGKLESSVAASRSIKKDQRTKFHHLVNYPMPDYSKVQPKVDCWRTKPKSGVKNDKARLSEGVLTKKYHLKNSPNPVTENYCQEIPKWIHHPMIPASPRVNKNPKLTSRKRKRVKFPKDKLRKPIHDTDKITNVSEAKASRMGPKISAYKRKPCPEPQDSVETECGCFPCFKRRKAKQTARVTEQRSGQVRVSSQERDGRAGKERPGFHRLKNFPMPDYNKLKPKVDCWRMEPKYGM